MLGTKLQILCFILCANSAVMTLLSRRLVALCLRVRLPSQSTMWWPDRAHSQQAKSPLTTYYPPIPTGLHAFSWGLRPQRLVSSTPCRLLAPPSSDTGSGVSDVGHAMTRGAGSHSVLTHWHFVHCHTPPRRARKTKLRTFLPGVASVQTDAHVSANMHTQMHASTRDTPARPLPPTPANYLAARVLCQRLRAERGQKDDRPRKRENKLR